TRPCRETRGELPAPHGKYHLSLLVLRRCGNFESIRFDPPNRMTFVPIPLRRAFGPPNDVLDPVGSVWRRSHSSLWKSWWRPYRAMARPMGLPIFAVH